MKAVRFLLIPATVAWFTAGIWWLSRPGSCACTAPRIASIVPAQAALIHLGPAADAEVSTITSLAGIASPASTDLVIPFSKNTGEFEPTAEQLDWCRSAVLMLGADPEAAVLVSGHTDADGDPEWNRRLSAYRARLVMNGLVNAGVPADRIRAEGLGADEPISDNLTSKGKALNRRVEVHLEQPLRTN